MSINTTKKKRSKKFDRPLGLTGVPDNDELKHLEKTILGTTPTAFESTISDNDSDEEISQKRARQDESEKKPAWVDDDDNLTYAEAVKTQKKKFMSGVSKSRDYQTIIRKKFQQVSGVPKWAKRSSKNSEEEQLFNKCGKFIRKSKYLESGLLEFEKLKVLNVETYVEGPIINVVKFHPKSTVAMVAGVSGIVSLFQVNGEKNTKLQSFHFKKYPIDCGAFVKNGEEFFIGSHHYKFFYCHNLMTGKSFQVNHSKLNNITKTENFCVSPNDDLIAVCGDTGKIYLLAASTKEYLDCLQMNCDVTAVCFNQDGSFLYSHGTEGEVYIWDMKSRTCIKKFTDDGCLTGTSISISKNNQFMACGSSWGIVNVYNRESVQSGEVSLPLKYFSNLTTPVNSVLFNSSSEVLAIASNSQENAVKLIHCPSMTVFKNFPQVPSKMKRPFSMDFSPNSGFFAVGDSGGAAHLFRLKYYGNY